MSSLPQNYHDVVAEIKNRVRASQYQALKAVNHQLIQLYWDIGRIVAEQQEAGSWGKSVVENLAQDLQTDFPGMGGFSVSNLWRMKLFFQTYQTDAKLAPMVREIGWTRNLVILEKCKDPQEREFYIKMTARMGWTKNVLIHQIENQTFEKTLLSQNNFHEQLPEKIQRQAKLAIKDEYLFDFLELSEAHSEYELERSLIARVEQFLREMGGLFAFVGSQYRLEVGNKEFYIDILLYHRKLKCLVAVELKTGEFLPEYVGKMQFYLAVLDDKVREPGENPSIGIILCKSKNRTIVEYALKESNKPIGISQYAITSSLPADLKSQLPSPEQIAKLLGDEM